MRRHQSPGPTRTRGPSTPIGLLIGLLITLVVGLGGCGGNDTSDDPESTGVRDRAREQLRAYGLPEDQAECVVDALGAGTVAATGDMEVLAAGQEYRDAVEDCPP